MAFSITLSDEQWGLVADLFDPPSRRGAPALIERRAMVDARLFLARTGCQWRYLPERYPPWGAGIRGTMRVRQAWPITDGKVATPSDGDLLVAELSERISKVED